MSPNGVDVVFDPVSGPLMQPAFRSRGWGGRYLIVGFAGGDIPALPVNLPLLKGAALVGVDYRQFGAVFEAAVLADKIARTGQVSEASMSCMLGSLLVRDPKDTLEVFGGDDLNLRDGYRALIGALERDPNSLQREPLRYALSMLGLERQLEGAR